MEGLFNENCVFCFVAVIFWGVGGGVLHDSNFHISSPKGPGT